MNRGRPKKEKWEKVVRCKFKRSLKDRKLTAVDIEINPVFVNDAPQLAASMGLIVGSIAELEEERA